MKRSVVNALCTTVFASALPGCAQAPTQDGSDWRAGAVCYEIFVRSFYASDGD